MLRNILMLTIFAVTGAFLSGCGGNASSDDSLECYDPYDLGCCTGETLCQIDIVDGEERWTIVER